MQTVFEKICSLLDSKNIPYKHDRHEPTYTSEDASRIRGVALSSGAKALVVKGHKSGTYFLCVIPANLRLDGRKAKKVLGEAIGFAKDPFEVTGCVPGSVPPFGSVLGLQTLCDVRLQQESVINFNAGSLTDSLQISYQDYCTAENPKIEDIAEEKA